jgi:hypothetical protein
MPNASFETLSAAMFQVEVFWVVSVVVGYQNFTLHPEDGGSMNL